MITSFSRKAKSVGLMGTDAVSEALGWRSGLDEKPKNARLLYAVIAVSTLVGILVYFAGINPIRAFFCTAVLNGLISPPLLLVIMLVASNKQVMGERVNTPLANIVVGATTLLMFVAAVAMIITW